MTNSDAVRIASRALALYLFIVAATSGIGLLSSTVSLVQAISDSSQINGLLNTQLMILAQ